MCASSSVTHNHPATCYHCGELLPEGEALNVVINGEPQPMCCIGCQAVASAIVEGGLESFYRYRTEVNARGNPDDDSWSVYDLPEIQSTFVIEREDGLRQACLLLEGITCAACSWLIETHLQKYPAVRGINLNITSHRCTLIWDAAVQPLSELLAALAHIGYKPRPATDEQQQLLIKKENRMALFRLGVAGFGMMQATMMTVGIYTGATDAWLNLLRWQSLLAATPVVFFSCWPFFKAAWQSLRARHLVMDVPVALAIGLAYIASFWATVYQTGDVYFESIAMFAFFLLLGRYVEMRARHRNREAFGNLAQLMPLTASRLTPAGGEGGSGGRGEESVPLKLLKDNDRVLVRAGETFPVDGIVVAGYSTAVEAILTGESEPVAKGVGDRVIAGTLNGDSPLEVRVTATGAATQLSAIERLAAQAADEKPTQVTMADKIARFFIARLLVVCACVCAFWLWYDASRALWVTLSVLVVTCPCALALAMPAALSASTSNLRKRGLLVTRGHVIETLTQINRVIFDKTGTLTQGIISLERVEPLGDANKDNCLALAAALEAQSQHPLASAFRPYADGLNMQHKRQFTAAGVEGVSGGVSYRLGTPDFVQQLWAQPQGVALPDAAHQWLLLGSSEGPLCWFAVADKVREDAAALVASLQAAGLAVELLSGDHSGAVAGLAHKLGIDQFTAGAAPDDKLEHIQKAQARGDKVLMLGDGINDIPVLAGADVSVAMASASDLAQIRADALLLHDRIKVVFTAIMQARRTRQIIRQNLRFSLTYNVLALPLAAAGWIAPWQAAIGMTASSLVVIFNSLRLSANRITESSNHRSSGTH